MNNDEETTRNFWDVWNNLEPYAPPVILFRLYYNDQGRPLFYTHEDRPGNYIDVTPEQFRDASMNVRVQNGKLIELKTTTTTKLAPGTSGTPCHPGDVTVVVRETDEHTKWSKHVFESN